MSGIAIFVRITVEKVKPTSFPTTCPSTVQIAHASPYDLNCPPEHLHDVTSLNLFNIFLNPVSPLQL